MKDQNKRNKPRKRDSHTGITALAQGGGHRHSKEVEAFSSQTSPQGQAVVGGRVITSGGEADVMQVAGPLVSEPKERGGGDIHPLNDPQDSRFYGIAYCSAWLEERAFEDEEAFFAWKHELSKRAPSEELIFWFNINDNMDKEMLARVQRRFDLHPLVREDISDVRQRPKFEEYEQSLYILLKMLTYSETKEAMEREQISIFWGRDWVLTIQEHGGDVFQHLRRRLREGIGLLRKRGSDYLVYGLFSAILDRYFVVLDRLNDRIEELEDALLEQTGHRELLEDLYLLRRQLMRVRKAVWPVREIVRGMQECESPMIQEEMSAYLRNLLDESMQIGDMVENARELAASLMDLHLSTVNTRMGVAMRWLAMVSLTFVPLNLIAAIYGMNFKYMPELQWRYGYFGILGLMVLSASGLTWLFYSRGWFRS